MVFSVGETVASAVVKEAVNLIRVAAEREVGLLWSFKDDLEAMGDTLETINAALKDADAAPAKDERTRLLLGRLKAAAHDSEDLLEEFADAGARVCTNWFCEVCSCCYNISISRTIFAHKMKSMRERLQKIQADAGVAGVAGVARSHGGMGSDFRDQDAISRRETWSSFSEYIVGREEDKEAVVSTLLRHTEKRTSVVSIHGFGGMGKTTLARLAFNAEPVVRAFDCRVWVHVSMKCDLRKIGNSIVSKLEAKCSDDLEDLKTRMKRLLTDKIFLIVLDDIWEKDSHELEKLMDFLNVGTKGSMVLVTTRYEHIATSMDPVLCHRLESLSDEECWDLFKKTAFISEAKEARLQHIGRAIVKKCKGVPLAVKSLAFMLKSKEGVNEWEGIRDNHLWELEEEQDISFERVLPSLKLSFYHMPAALKRCFIYCSVFPKGSDIDKDLLIQQWIALGFIKLNGSSQPEGRGEDYVVQLLGMSFLQISTSQTPVTRKRIKAPNKFHLHDLVYDLARSLAMVDLLCLDKENMSKVRSTDCDCRCAAFTDCNPTTISNNIMRKLRALHVNEWRRKGVPSRVFATKFLRVLNLSGCSLLVLPSCIKQLKLLRYLDASGMQDETLKHLINLQNLQTLKLSGSLLGALPHEMGFLEQLRYLNLHGCSNLSVLPESLCCLGNLRYLDMSSCSAIKELPPHFGSVLPESLYTLGNLRYLDMSSCSAVKKLPLHFGNLVNLATLNLSSCCELQELPPHFGNLANLETLNLSSCCELIKLPEDFGNLQKLCVLDLSNCRKLDALPESFAKLGYLEVLNLSCCYELKEIPELFGNLQHLLVLELSDCHKLQKLPESITKLIFLKELLLSDCWELTALPESFGNLKQLQYLDLSSSQISALPESVSKLVNLEYMNVSWCTDLQMLPGNYGNLVKLEELNMSYIGNGHINIPKGMAEMSNLKILLADGFISRSWENEEDNVFFDALRGYSSIFIFGETKPSDLNLRDNTLQVGGLGHVQNLVEVEELQLWKRRQLHSLKVSWAYGTGFETADELVPQEAVLEKLQPPITLERFELWCCTISTFPSWMTDIASFLPNLAHLELRYLETCDCLPPLGQLPKLHILVISDIPYIKEVDQRFSGGARPRPFQKLRNLVIENMQNLEKWHTYTIISGGDVEFMFPVLHHVKINRCPKLIFEPLLPRSVSWEIERSNEVLSSGVQPNSPFYYMPTIRVLIKFCTLSSDCLMGLQSLTSLKFLSMRRCRGLDNWRESIGMLTSLKSLDIEMSDVPACFGGVTSLESLRIQNCPVNYSTLEQVLLLTALVDLSICCSRHTKFVNEQEVNWLMSMVSSLSNLVNLELDYFIGCDRLPPLHLLEKLNSLTLRHMPNLKMVHENISEVTNSLPMLRALKIESMPNLERWSTVRANDVQIFPGLQLLKVYDCPKLKFVPFLPACTKCIINGSTEVLMLEHQNNPPWDMPTSELSCLFLHGTCTGLQNFKFLISLSVLACTNLSSWQESVISIASLQKLELCQSEIPEWLHQLSSLRELHIIKCKTPLNLSQFVKAPHPIALTIEDCWETLAQAHHEVILDMIRQFTTVQIIDCEPIMHAEWRNGELFKCKLRKSSEWYMKPADAGSLPDVLGRWQEEPTDSDQPGHSGTK